MGGCVGFDGVVYYLCWEGWYEEGGEGVDEGEKGLYGNWDSCSGLEDGTDLLILHAYHTKYTTRLVESRDDGFDIGPIDWCFVVLHLG